MADPVRGAGQPTWPLSPYQVQVTYSASQGIMRGTGADWFGPLNPLAPIAPPDVAGRRFDFPPGYNIVTKPRAYEPIGFAELRAFADAYDLLRLVIETRKDQVERLQWTINPRDPKFKRKNAQIAPEMQARITAIEAFFRKPDGFTKWKTWIRGLLEDMFVIDAASLYCQRTRGGKLCGLRQLDGGTIKRVIDDWGGTPLPYRGDDGKMVYPPAYQQVLKGFPAVNYSTRDIMYRPRNVRPHKVYGYSPVQQILLTVQIALRRQMWQLDYYTEGSIPDALIGVPNSWTPEQVRDFQNYWDTEFAGDLGKRRRAKFVPGDTAAKVHETKEPEQKNDFDEWLARIVCFAFSVPPQWATKVMNRATAQQHSEDSESEGLEPTKEWIKELIDDIIVDEFNSPDLELAWVEADETDPAKNETILEGRVKVGGITINEFRDNLGLDPYPDEAANKPMVLTATGYVPIEENTIAGKQAKLDAFGPPPPSPFGAQGGADGQNGNENGPASPKPDAASESASEAEKLNGKFAFTKRSARGGRLAPVPFDRPKTRAAIKAVRAVLAKAFDKLRPRILAQVTDDLGKVAKDRKPKSRAQQIANDADLAVLTKTAADIADDLSGVAADSAGLALAQLGVDDEADLVNQVNNAAVAAARDRAAELVGMKWDGDELVENPEAELAITDTTRDLLRRIIADGLENNIGTAGIAQNIVDSLLFSDERADLIAQTEVARANGAAALVGYKGARTAGVKVKKVWMLGPNPCEICEGNADDGEIDLDDDFSSGDDAPPAHPNCECAVAPSVEE